MRGRLALYALSATLALIPLQGFSQETPPTPPPQSYTLEPVTKGLSAPVAITHAPPRGGAEGDPVYIVQREGEIRVLSQGKIRSPSLLDIEDIVGEGPGQGLHSLAFSPNFHTDKSFYVTFSDRQGDTIVAKFLAKEDDSAEAEDMQVVLKVVKPSIGHAMSSLSFGRDGNLYIAIPDGGEPEERSHAQSPQSLLGKVLRISVTNGSPYQIPADNPHKDSHTILPEIWASGFHAPKHLVPSPSSDTLILVDDGTSVADEINEVTKDGNYGWDRMEGTKCLRPPCAPSFIAPRFSVPHTQSGSITGGVVYSGKQLPALAGKYLYLDATSKTVRALSIGHDSPSARPEEPQAVLSLSEPFSAIGEDGSGEVLLTSQKGGVFRIRP